MASLGECATYLETPAQDKTIPRNGVCILETEYVECWVFWDYLWCQGIATRSKSRSIAWLCMSEPPISVQRVTDMQTKVEGTYNNLIAGTIGGFIATTINTPCPFSSMLRAND